MQKAPWGRGGGTSERGGPGGPAREGGEGGLGFGAEKVSSILKAMWVFVGCPPQIRKDT